MSEVESGLEVDVWIRCPSTEELWRFAQHLDPPADGSSRVKPEAGRRNMVLTWQHLQEDPDAEAWHDAMFYGLGQAAMLVVSAREAGIEAATYAIRIQPVDAEFMPEVAATAFAASDGEHERG